MGPVTQVYGRKMLTGGASVITDQPTRAPRSARWAAAIAIVSVLLLGVVGALAVWDRETSQAEDRDRQLADQAAVTMTAQGTRNVSALGGASALVVDDGVITQPELDAFAADVTAGSALTAVAYERRKSGRSTSFHGRRRRFPAMPCPYARPR